MENANHSLAYDFDNCATTCHGQAGDGDALETKKEALESEIHDAMFALGAHLTTAGVMTENTEDGVITGYSPKSGTTATAAQARGIWNYMTVYQDHSYGTHNPTFVRKLLAETKTELGY
jgi:hypothetical protein